nr:hypothetical protein [Tanacetum cinerariifolium]
MANLVITNHVSVSIDHAPSPHSRILRRRFGYWWADPSYHSINFARLVRHDDMIDQLCNRFQDMSLDRMGMIEYYVRTLEARVDVTELRAPDLRTRVRAESSGTAVIVKWLQLD